MECKQKENLRKCNCTYEPCQRKGNCGECLQYHLRSRELPACCFPNHVERTYDRSFKRFAELIRDRQI
jgi:hypothetical protein